MYVVNNGNDMTRKKSKALKETSNVAHTMSIEVYKSDITENTDVYKRQLL